MASFRKVGGLYHWRVGRVGGALYVTKPAPKGAIRLESLAARDARISGRLNAAALIAGVLCCAAAPAAFLIWS